MKFKTEAELAACVVKWLEEFTVYQEVESPTGGVADIVVDVNGLPWVIECKKSFSFAVMEQAARWKLFGVPRVSIAIPQPKQRRSSFGKQVAEWQGVGILYVDHHGRVDEWLQPRFTRPIKRHGKRWNLLDECCDEHKTFCEAGSQNGRWTPFKMTVRNLYDAVRSSPGVTMKEAVDKMDSHHYGSNKAASSNLLRWLRCGVIKDIEARQEGRSLRLYPTDKRSTHA